MERRKMQALLILLISLSAFGELLYERVEETMTWPGHGLSNPFTGVELRLVITAPATRSLGSSFTFYGFHDGNGSGGQTGDVWRFRILLDEPGNWTVVARFVEPGTSTQKSGAPSEQTFNYTVSSTKISGEHGHVRVDPQNPRRFKHADGTSWVPFAMHGSMLIDQTIANAQTWINEHANRGVDAITVRFHSEVAGALGGIGHYHWLKTDGTRTTVWPGSANNFDYNKFDVASWQYNERIIEYAQSKSVKLSVWFGISGLNRQYESYGPKDFPNNTTLGPKQKLFIKYFLARWAVYTNWWHWTTDSEYEEDGAGALDRNRTYAAELRALNPWKTMVTTHVLSNWSPGRSPEFDHATLQRRVADSDNGATDCRSFITDNDDYNMPVYNAEGVWMLSNATRARIASMTHLMAGGVSHIAHDGSNHAYSSWGAGWSRVVTRPKEDAAVLGTLSNFFNRTQGIDINAAGSPHNELVSVSGGNLALCLADPGKTYYIWADRGGTVSVNLSGIPGTFSVTRYKGNDLGNPVTLADISGSGTRSLGATPATGFGNDYLFIVRNKASQGLTIATQSLPAGYRTIPYSQTFTAINNNGSITWSRTSGTFPAGLSLSGAVLSGTPSAAGSFTFTIRAQDSDTAVEKQFTVTIHTAPETVPPVVSNVSVINQTASGATVTWQTNEPATSRVQWGNALGNYTGDSFEQPGFRTSHSLRISDSFTSNTRYYILIITADTLGNVTNHTDSFFFVASTEFSVTLAGYNGTATAPTIVENGFVEGADQCNDRTGPPVYTNVPSEHSGMTYLLTARDDRQAGPGENEAMYRVNASLPCTVFVLFDNDAGIPSWISSDGWMNAGLSVTASGNAYSIYKKYFQEGDIDLKRQYSGSSEGTGYVFKAGGPSGAGEKRISGKKPVLSAYPNPFNPTVRIVADPGPCGTETVRRAILKIFNPQGKCVKTMNVSEALFKNGVVWDAGNMASGLYIISIITDNIQTAGTVLLLR